MSKNTTNQDSLVKSIGMVLLGIIVLALFYNVFFSPGSMTPYGGGGYQGMGEHMGGGGYYPMGGGFSFSLGGLLGGILLILVKLLSILLVVGLVLGIWVIVRDYLFTDGANPFASLTQNTTGTKTPCPKCGSQINPNWAFCPICGEALNKGVGSNSVPSEMVQGNSNASQS